METFSLSVVLATFNGAKYVVKQIDSILNQSYPIVELIIVDDCSTDETVDIIKNYQQQFDNIVFKQNEKNLGAIGSFQEAVKLAHGDYIAFSDQDDIWELNKLEKQMTMLKDNIVDREIPTLLFHDLTVIDPQDNILSKSFWKQMKFSKAKFCFEKLLFGNVVTGCTCIINQKMKDSFLEVNINKIMMHDHWFTLIAFSFGQVFYSHDQLIRYRNHPNSVTAKDSTSFFLQIKNLYNNLFGKEYIYFHDNFIQAKEFKLLYFDKLNEQQKFFLDSMLKLEKKANWYKIARPYFRFRQFVK